jgi:hypothetical protein
MYGWSPSKPWFWVGGWFALLWGTAGLLALIGRGQEAVKLAFGAGLFPVLVVLGAVLVITVSRPRRSITVGGVLGVVVVIGALLWGTSLLVWLPFSPWRWRPEDMPPVLGVPFVAGLYLFSGGAVLGTLVEFVVAIRAREFRRAVSPALLLALVAFIAVGIIAELLRR